MIHQHPPVPEEIFVFFSTTDSLFARLIRRVTKGPWSHCGIGFVLSDRSRIYFEALFRRGFVGPRNFDDVLAWRDADPKHHRLQVYYLDLPDHLARAKLERCLADVGKKGYFALQLLSMYLFERLRIPVPRSPDRVVCSEEVSRILDPQVPLTDPVHLTHDTVNPNSAWLALGAWLADRSAAQHAARLRDSLRRLHR